jgi:hypothetical protein
VAYRRSAIASVVLLSGLVAAPVVAQQARTLPGTLAKPIASYTGDELYALVRSLQYTGDSVKNRRCRDLPGCSGISPSIRTRLAVAAVIGVDSLWSGNIPANGVIAARASNRGGARDEMYGMRPGARFEYYLVVLPGLAGGAPRWRLEQLEVVGETRTHTQLMLGRFRACNDHGYQAGARADFRSCGAAAAVRPASATSIFQGGDPPIWIGCATGCCVSETGLQG